MSSPPLSQALSANPAVATPHDSGADLAIDLGLETRLQPAALRCSDGRLLAAQWFEPPAAQGLRAVAVIGAATAVPASYYRHFAEWLARRGYAVLTFDYRGIAASREALRPGEDVRLRDWARVDMAAALHAAATDSFDDIKKLASEPTLTLTLEANADAATLFTAAEAKTGYFVRILVTSVEEYSAGETYEFQITAYGTFEVPTEADNDGVFASTFVLHLEPHADLGGSAYEIIVTNAAA